MQHYKTLLLFVIILLPMFSFRPGNAFPVKWVLTKECSLKVNGSTNINKFSCIIPEYIKPDTLTLSKENSNPLIKITGSMALSVQNFDCRNPMMTSDLRKTLKAKVFPEMTIKFINLSKYPDPNAKDEAIKGAVTIELAGVTKRFEVDYKYIMNGNGALKLIGTKQVNFSDFNLIPPRKIGGMIRTNNELNVEFLLNVKILN
jgi:hypothetical protein